MDASRSRYGRWPNPVRDSNGQHDNAVRLSFRLTRGAARPGRYTPLGHDPATVRWRKWIMPRGLVRAAGIEPALLSERDFEWDETKTGSRRNATSRITSLLNIINDGGVQPDFSLECVSICVNRGRSSGAGGLSESIASSVRSTFGSPAAKRKRTRQDAELGVSRGSSPHFPHPAWPVSRSSAPAAHRDTGGKACMAGRIEARCATGPPSKPHRSA